MDSYTIYIASYNLSVMDAYNAEDYKTDLYDSYDSYDSYSSSRTGNETADYEYLTELSTDAAPVIAKHHGNWVDKYFRNNKNFYNRKGIRKFNFSGYKAKILAESR